MYKKFFKRFFDIVCALMVFIFLWPLYLFLMLLILIKLGRPIYFKQIRPGKNGELFVLYKFRSMKNEYDKSGNLLKDEERMTKFGKFLRATSLDEIPEAINIFKGEMSVIGPRPLLVKDFVFFDEQIMHRQDVRPGLSGLAQVNGRNNISWEDKFKFDLQYVDSISFRMDFSLVFKTVFKAFIKHDDISRDGFVTDLDYGDYLLKSKLINENEYLKLIQKSNQIIDNYRKL